MACPNWVESAFSKRECNKFIPSAKDNARCCCGHLWQYHRDGSPATLRNEEDQELHWSPSRHTHLLPTDAYGTLEFQGGPHPTKAQYIRLSHDTPPHLILQLLTREWGLGLPKLLISIQGGKTNFDLQPKLKKVIRKGLLKAAKTTGAWVFTGGTNTGVTRQAGEALASETNLRDRGNRIVSVGIAPWGIVERRQDLLGRNKDAPYHPINSPKSRYAALNSHHSFFLLVDNGTAGKYGPEIILRRKLENYISKQRIEAHGGLATPVVCVVIEGGPQTIRQVLEYVTDSPPLPVIVCDGTGRAADILAFVHKYAVCGQNVLENNRVSIVSSLERVFDLKTDQAEKLFIELMQCVKKKDLITVFRLKEGSELDQSILSALLHAKKLNPPEQLSLALTWNRVDIARTHVFNENVEWPEGSLEQAMMDALVNDRIEFVKLLLEQGVSMSKFLTVQRLEDLYNSKQGPPNTLQYIIRDVTKTTSRDYRSSLIDIGLVINKLMGGAFRSTYTRKKFRSSFASLRPMPSLNGSIFGSPRINSHIETKKEHLTPPVFEYPFSELLVWAVLTKRQPLALLMWQHGEEAVAKALVAAKLYKALAHEGADDDLETEVYQELRNYAKEFEALALEVLDYCYQQDEDKANQLLTYELKNWSKQTCLSLAVAVNHRALLSHPCCQILLADLWLGGLRTRKSTNIKVILGLLSPPMILLLGFRSREELRSMPQTCEEHWEDEPFRYSDSESDTDSDPDAIDMRNEHDPESLETKNNNDRTIMELEENLGDLVKSSEAKEARVGAVPTSSTGTALLSQQSSHHLQVPLFNTASSHSSAPHATNAHFGSSVHQPLIHSTSIPSPVMSKSSTLSIHDNGIANTFPLSASVIDSTFNDPTSKELLARTKFYEFYNAPITKFWAHSIAFIFFLCLFTYVVLVRLPVSPEWPEWYVLVYIVTFLLEKIREILSTEPAKLSKKIEVWSEKLWNVFDMTFTLFFLLGFSLRMQTGVVRDVGRVIYCVDIIYWYLKVLEILSANKYLGPLVMMMGKMIKNMAYFVILLLVVLMAFGVCRQSILFPNEEPRWRLARHIFYQPYFMLYGEVFAGDIDPPCGEEGEVECVPGRWITPTVMSMYLLVANILLINLLIAVFNNIFTSVNAISHQVWMFQRFQVVMEFEEKPVFPPPLIIISHFHRTFKFFYRSWKSKAPIYGHGLKRFLGGENLERVHDFEEECVDAYISEKEQKLHMSTEERVRVMTERTEAVAQRLEDMHNKVVLTLTSINNFDFHMKRLHEDLQEANASYALVHRFMLRHVRTARSSSGSNGVTPTGSGSNTPLSGSQLSLRQMLEEVPRRTVLRQPSLGENEEDSSEKEEEETIHGKHGNLIVKMNIHERKKKANAEKSLDQNQEAVKNRNDDIRKQTSYSEHSGGTRERRRTNSRKSSLKKQRGEKKVISPSKVSFRGHSQDISATDSDERNYRRSASYPDEVPAHVPTAKYERCLSATSRPMIHVIPPSTPPPIITLTAEYTSLGDELETVCMAHLSPPSSPRFHTNRNHLRPRHRSDSAAPWDIYIDNPLRDAEEADYNLMEGIIQRRMHRDSENLAVSLEELCSIVSGGSEEEEADTPGPSHERRCSKADLLKRHSAGSLDQITSFSRSKSPNRRVLVTPMPLGSPTRDLRSNERSLSWCLPQAGLATPERMSPRSVSPHSLQLGFSSRNVSPLFAHRSRTPPHLRRQSLGVEPLVQSMPSFCLQVPVVLETEGVPPNPDQNETEC